MRSLLTRAGQVRNCRCNTCVGVAKTIIRRSTTGAEVKVNYGHAFTTLYTSIFATAAVIDAKYKDDRRKNLDARITEAKDAVAQLQAQNAASELDAQPTILERVAREGRHYRDSAIFERTDGSSSIIASTDDATTPTSRIFEQYGAKYWEIFHGTNIRRTLRGLKRSDYRMLEEWLKLSLESDDIAVPGSTPEEWTSNVTQLVDYLLLEHDRISAQDDLLPVKSPLREAIDRLKAKGFPHHRWKSSDPTAFKDAPARLSRRMARDIDSDTDAIGTIERICYNLLTSQYPLNIHTYNTLIVHLNKAGHHKLAQRILQSHFAHFRHHHPQSQAVILNHDREFGNYAGIHRNIAVIFRNSSLYFSRGGEYLLESIVRAYSGVCNMTDAVVVLRHGLSMGLTIGPQALYQMIGLCIWKLDRALAVVLIRAFADNPEQFESMLTAEPAAQSVLLHQLNYLLDIADLWRHPSKLGAQLKKHDLDPERFRRFRMTITICDLQRQSNQIARMTRRLQQILARMDAPKCNRMSRADNVELVVKRAVKAADDFDFHMEAAMPSSWVNPNLKALTPAHAPRRRRRVWTERDYEMARVSLRLAVSSKEAALEAGRPLNDPSSELHRMGSRSAVRAHGRQGIHVYASEPEKELAVGAGAFG